ncbi:MAG: VanZ family protein [Bacteroidota bacterium]
MAVIAVSWLSSQPQGPVRTDFFPMMDKVMHFSGFFILGTLFQVFILTNFPGIKKMKILTAVILFGILFGLIDEWHQSFVPGRDADFFDWLADTLGSTFSIVLYPIIKKYINKIL